MSRGAAVVVAVALLLSSRRALADGASPCGGEGHPGVVLRSDGLEPALRSGIVEQLRAALAGRSLDLCEPPNAAGAVAELDVSSLAAAEGAAPAAGVVLTLTVRDAVTDKRVSRDLDLRNIPEDGRALVIAQAADELLRASWAELLVADAPRPKREVPPEVLRAVPPPDAPPPAPRVPRAPVLEVGAALALEHFGTGLTQLGPDLSLRAYPLPRFGATARAGIRSGARAEVARGSVDPSSVVLAVGAAAALLPRTGRVGADAGPELVVTHVHYAAEADAQGGAHSASATALHASLAARAWVVVTAPLRVTLAASVGAPIHAVRAVAAGETVASAGGALVGGELGLGGAW